MAGQANTRALLIDALGTLLRLEPVPPRLREALSRRGTEISHEQADAAFRAEVAYYLRHHVEGRDPISLAQLRERCAQVMADELGVPVPVDALLEAIEFSRWDDARPALEHIRATRPDLRVVVVSNWDSSLRDGLAGAGLGQLVDEVVTSADAGVAKPDPLIFRAALEAAGCDASEALHVGDSVENDLEGAAAAGVRAVLLDRDGTQGPGAIRSLGELHSLI
jgi:putative hydrolase of the HAD superfamily